MRASTVLLVAALLPQLAHAQSMEFKCEAGQTMGVVGDANKDRAIELRWKGRSYSLERVSTTTGAQRFEEDASGLVWISIPSKAMLLDKRRGQPIANECLASTDVSLKR